MREFDHGQSIAPKLPARVQFSSLIQTTAELSEALAYCSTDEIILTESGRSDGDLFTQFSNIVCLECSEEYSDAEDFLVHILRCQFGEQHVRLYHKLGVVYAGAQQLLQEAQKTRTVYVGRSLSDKPSLAIITPASSRLAPFLLAGTTISVNRPAPMFCEKYIMNPSGNRVPIYFSVNAIKKLQDDIDAYHERRRKKKEMKKYLRLLRNFELNVPDIMESTNNLEVSRLLELATGIPAGTQFIPTRSISILVSEVFPYDFVQQDGENLTHLNGNATENMNLSMLQHS